MFGIKLMQKQRDRLYERTQLLEKRAAMSREKVIDQVVHKAISPEGLITSFVLGASTQLDITKKIRKNLLNGASKEVLSFLITQLAAYLAIDPEKTAVDPEKTEVDPKKAAVDPQKPTDDSQKTPATEAPLSSDKSTQKSTA